MFGSTGINKMFQQMAAASKQHAGAPQERVAARRYFTHLQHTFPANIDPGYFLELQRWQTCRGQDLETAMGAFDALEHMFTDHIWLGLTKPQILLIKANPLKLLLPLEPRWLQGNKVARSGEFSVQLLLMTSLGQGRWESRHLNDVSDIGNPYDIVLSTQECVEPSIEYKVKVLATCSRWEDKATHQFQLTCEEFECATRDKGQYVPVLVFGTPVDANASGSDLEFLIIRKPVRQAVARHIIMDNQTATHGPVSVCICRSLQ